MSETEPPAPEDSPIGKAVLAAATTSLANLWKRIEKRAPVEMRLKVEQVLRDAEDIATRDASVRDRVKLAKGLEDLAAELRGRRPWEPTFYKDGRLGVTRAQDPITIKGAVDQLRLEAFYERYVQRAERAFERLEYFFRRSGILTEEEAKKGERKPWDQPYLNFDSYRELIWGKVAKTGPKTRRE